MCTSFWRISAKHPFISRYYSLRSFYAAGLLAGLLGAQRLRACMLQACWLFPPLESTLQCQFSVTLTLICAAFGSLYEISPLIFLRFCGPATLRRSKIIPTCCNLEKRYLLQSCSTHIFGNASIFAAKVAAGIFEGLNVTHLIRLASSKVRFLAVAVDIESGPRALGVAFGGRIKGQNRSRWVGKMDALCVSCFSGRILDSGYKTFVSNLGLCGVKLGTII